LVCPRKWPKSVDLAALKLEPTLDWANGFTAHWNLGEEGATRRLHRFINHGLKGYSRGRDHPAIDGTSRLSPYLHFGEISPHQVWDAVQKPRSRSRQAVDRYCTELGWREFSHHLLFHFPHTPEQPLRKDFKAFPWIYDRRALWAWQRGRTGFPIVDAGMRQLWRIGWMHNRVRMIVASFLVKDLLIPWVQGAMWFWDTLVDADLGNNTLGWQWVAGCGADAAPYFRIFNPVSQGERFDPEGDYVREWVPELAKLPKKWIHRPAEAPPEVLAKANVEIGMNYPKPLVDHAEARQRALKAFEKVKKSHLG
jgi:deoxyribodipyrimidine photo-lyase